MPSITISTRRNLGEHISPTWDFENRHFLGFGKWNATWFQISDSVWIITEKLSFSFGSPSWASSSPAEILIPWEAYPRLALSACSLCGPSKGPHLVQCSAPVWRRAPVFTVLWAPQMYFPVENVFSCSDIISLKQKRGANSKEGEGGCRREESQWGGGLVPLGRRGHAGLHHTSAGTWDMPLLSELKTLPVLALSDQQVLSWSLGKTGLSVSMAVTSLTLIHIKMLLETRAW